MGEICGVVVRRGLTELGDGRQIEWRGVSTIISACVWIGASWRHGHGRDAPIGTHRRKMGALRSRLGMERHSVFGLTQEEISL